MNKSTLTVRNVIRWTYMSFIWVSLTLFIGVTFEAFKSSCGYIEPIQSNMKNHSQLNSVDTNLMPSDSIADFQSFENTVSANPENHLNANGRWNYVVHHILTFETYFLIIVAISSAIFVEYFFFIKFALGGKLNLNDFSFLILILISLALSGYFLGNLEFAFGKDITILDKDKRFAALISFIIVVSLAWISRFRMERSVELLQHQQAKEIEDQILASLMIKD